MSTCKICKKKFKSGRSLGSHITSAHRKKSCSVCGEDVPVMTFRRHEKSCANKAQKKACPCCEKQFAGNNKFCSKRSASTRKKISLTLKGKTRSKMKTSPCKACNKPITHVPSRKRSYCDRKCMVNSGTWRRNLAKSLKGKKKKRRGGPRTGHGRKGKSSKTGWYKGYWCDSSWELAWIIYNLDHKIQFERNMVGFEYSYLNKQRKYYPDFLLPDGSYVEIKGFSNKQFEAKKRDFPHALRVLYQKDMESYLAYVKKKHGNDFISLYDGNPHNMILNKCKVCGAPVKYTYCGQSCVMKDRHKQRRKKNNAVLV